MINNKIRENYRNENVNLHPDDEMSKKICKLKYTDSCYSVIKIQTA
jgi:hypothetical protein